MLFYLNFDYQFHKGWVAIRIWSRLHLKNHQCNLKTIIFIEISIVFILKFKLYGIWFQVPKASSKNPRSSLSLTLPPKKCISFIPWYFLWQSLNLSNFFVISLFFVLKRMQKFYQLQMNNSWNLSCNLYWSQEQMKCSIVIKHLFNVWTALHQFILYVSTLQLTLYFSFLSCTEKILVNIRTSSVL